MQQTNNHSVSSTRSTPASREATAFGTSRLVAGLVTVNGNGPGCQRREHKEKTRLNPTVRIETTPRHTQNKTINTLQQPEKDHVRTVGYYEPTTMILDHLAFSTNLSAIANGALGGPSKASSEDLSVGTSRVTSHLSYMLELSELLVP